MINADLITQMTIRRVRFTQPRRTIKDKRLVEVNEAIELSVQTQTEFPIRDLTPALFVGEQVISSYNQTGPKQYLFFTYNLTELIPGALISIGIPGLSQAKVPTNFRFNLDGPLVS